MNRSKLFLGATTCLLAVAGIAAAKAGDKVKGGFYCTGLNPITGHPNHTGHCITTASNICPTGTMFTCYYPQGSAPNVKVYTVYATQTSTTTLCQNDVNVCKTLVKYNDIN